MPTPFRLSRWIDSQGLALALALLVAPVALWAQSGDEAEDTAPLTADDFADVEEVEVIGTLDTGDNAAELERFSVAITDSISIEDLLRFGDSDVAAALKRLVGVAVTGGKYANVRGLDGRYISSTLNGALMPSTDPFRRDVQLDLFPSEILGGIDIQKSYTSDLPGDTTGGIIRMTSRDIPDVDEAGLSISLGYVSGVTGESLLTYAGGGGDLTGFDDGTRALPGAVRAILPSEGARFTVCAFDGQQGCVERDVVAEAATSLSRTYNPEQATAPPALGFAGSYGRRIARDGGDFGYYGTLTYGQSSGSRQGARFDNVQGDADGNTQWDTATVSLNGYFVAGWRSDAGWDLTSKTMLLRDSEDRTSIESGLDTTNADILQVDTTLEWVERQFLGQSVEASLPMFGSHTLDLRAGYAQTRRDSPDRRFIQYRARNFVPTVLERSFSELVEDNIDLGADYRLPLVFGDSGIFTNLRFGVVFNQRDRDNSLVRLGVIRAGSATGVDLSQDPETLLTPERFRDGTFRLRSVTADTDSYTAKRDTNAIYVSTETDFGEALSLTVGVRLEDYSIDIDYPNGTENDSSVSDQDSTDVLPGINLTYRFADSWQLRGGLSRTVSRPDITELAASIFYDAEGRIFVGCPTCTDSTIDNVDLRVERYFGLKNSISLALFHKSIDEPLERTVGDASNGSIRGFDNGESAVLYGAELDGSWLVYDGIDNVLTISGNIALIESESTLSEDAARLEGVDRRQLQGQSPFLANLQLAFDNFAHDILGTLAVNYFDDRLDSAARGRQSSLFEKGRIDVNLSAEKSFRSGSKVSLRLRNLLDTPIERTQDGRIRETYRTGVSVSLGYSYSF